VVQIPTELASGQQYTVIAMVNGALSLPDTLSDTSGRAVNRYELRDSLVRSDRGSQPHEI